MARPTRALVQELLKQIRTGLTEKPTGLSPFDDRPARLAMWMVTPDGVDEDVRVVQKAAQRSVPWGPP